MSYLENSCKNKNSSVSFTQVLQWFMHYPIYYLLYTHIFLFEPFGTVWEKHSFYLKYFSVHILRIMGTFSSISTLYLPKAGTRAVILGSGPQLIFTFCPSYFIGLISSETIPQSLPFLTLTFWRIISYLAEYPSTWVCLASPLWLDSGYTFLAGNSQKCCSAPYTSQFVFKVIISPLWSYYFYFCS